jgi:hypothetical protein
LEGWSSTVELHPQTDPAGCRLGRRLTASSVVSRSCVAAIAGATEAKTWWAEQDSNLRRLSRQIYSLVHLAALVSARLRRARVPSSGSGTVSFTEPEAPATWS